MKFELSEKEEKAANAWMKKQNKKCDHYVGAVGGAFTYSFTPTGIGYIVVIKDNVTNEELDITDFSMW